VHEGAAGFLSQPVGAQPGSSLRVAVYSRIAEAIRNNLLTPGSMLPTEPTSATTRRSAARWSGKRVGVCGRVDFGLVAAVACRGNEHHPLLQTLLTAVSRIRDARTPMPMLMTFSPFLTAQLVPLARLELDPTPRRCLPARIVQHGTPQQPTVMLEVATTMPATWCRGRSCFIGCRTAGCGPQYDLQVDVGVVVGNTRTENPNFDAAPGRDVPCFDGVHICIRCARGHCERIGSIGKQLDSVLQGKLVR
jgi:hypothetical protein